MYHGKNPGLRWKVSGSADWLNEVSVAVNVSAMEKMPVGMANVYRRLSLTMLTLRVCCAGDVGVLVLFMQPAAKMIRVEIRSMERMGLPFQTLRLPPNGRG